MQLDIPIPILLIHLRWFFDEPAKVVLSWIMTFDLDLDYYLMMDKSNGQKKVPDKYFLALKKDTSDNEEADVMITGSRSKDQDDEGGLTIFHSSGDRYQRRGVDLVEAATRSAIAFQKSLPNAQRAEEFAKEFTQLTAKFTLKWKEKEGVREQIPTTFLDEQKPSEKLTDWKKGKTRRRRFHAIKI